MRSSPVGHYLRMLDVVGDRIDDAGHQHLVLRQGLMLKHLVFVCVPWIGEWQVQAANFGPTQDRQNICERHVVIVRSLVVAPTDMEPHFVARNIDEGRVDGSDHSFNELLEIFERPLAEGDMALEGQVGRIDLEVKAAADNGLVFDT
jgi:hypothetical protein